MKEDFSWNLSVPSYLAVYRQALGRKTKASQRTRPKSRKSK
jgi:glycogen synthase